MFTGKHLFLSLQHIAKVNLCIQSECGTIMTGKTPHFNTFHAVKGLIKKVDEKIITLSNKTC